MFDKGTYFIFRWIYPFLPSKANQAIIKKMDAWFHDKIYLKGSVY